VWDLEAGEPKLDAETWDEWRQRCGVGCAVVWDDDSLDWEVYGPRDCDALATRLERAELVVSYNGRGYDNIVLAAAIGRPLKIAEELDLWNWIWWRAEGSSWGKGYWGLGAVGERTLGYGKTGKGEDAPAQLKDGDWGTAVSYCIRDVRLLRDLWKFIQRHGYVIDPAGRRMMVGTKKGEEVAA